MSVQIASNAIRLIGGSMIKILDTNVRFAA
jgi:hypothetical protein